VREKDAVLLRAFRAQKKYEIKTGQMALQQVF